MSSKKFALLYQDNHEFITGSASQISNKHEITMNIARVKGDGLPPRLVATGGFAIGGLLIVGGLYVIVIEVIELSDRFQISNFLELILFSSLALYAIMIGGRYIQSSIRYIKYYISKSSNEKMLNLFLNKGELRQGTVLSTIKSTDHILIRYNYELRNRILVDVHKSNTLSEINTGDNVIVLYTSVMRLLL